MSTHNPARLEPVNAQMATLANRFESLRSGLDLARALHNNIDILAASVATNLLSLALPIFLLQVYDRIVPNQAVSTLTLFVIGFIAVLAIDAVLNLCRSYVIGWNGARLQHALSCAAIDRLLSSDVQAFEAQAPGVQLQRLRAIDTLRSFYAGQATLLWIDLPFAALFLGLIALIGQELVLMPLVILVLAALAAMWSGQKLRAALEDRTGSDNRRYNFILDVLSKTPTVKSIGMESLMVRRYERLQGYSAAATYRSTYYSSLARGIGAMSSQVMMAAVAAYGSMLVIGGSMSIGSLAACTLLAGRAARPLLRLLGVWTQYQTVQIARRQVREILAMPQESAGRKATAGDARAQMPARQELEGGVEFKNVEFRYSGKTQPILKNMSIKIAPKEIIGITGSNGTGKSALLNLVSGLLKPESGDVLIDGVSAQAFDPALLRSQICYLPQNGVLFDGTILENMTMFQSEERLDQAFEIANRLKLSDVIALLPGGYDTRVGDRLEDGLPGGIRQRIAIVRALCAVKDPRIILFDEANALLDPQSDTQLVELLRDYAGRATMIIVSHRPKVLDLADRTFVLRDGDLVEGYLNPSVAQVVNAKGAAQ